MRKDTSSSFGGRALFSRSCVRRLQLTFTKETDAIAEKKISSCCSSPAEWARHMSLGGVDGGPEAPRAHSVEAVEEARVGVGLTAAAALEHVGGGRVHGAARQQQASAASAGLRHCGGSHRFKCCRGGARRRRRLHAGRRTCRGRGSICTSSGRSAAVHGGVEEEGTPPDGCPTTVFGSDGEGSDVGASGFATGGGGRGGESVTVTERESKRGKKK